MLRNNILLLRYFCDLSLNIVKAFTLFLQLIIKEKRRCCKTEKKRMQRHSVFIIV